MGSIVSKATDAMGLTDTSAAGDATKAAANAQGATQQQALDYLKQQNALPTQLRDIGLNRQIDYLTGKSDISQDPFYKAMLGGQEESALRARSATGNLRSGQAISDIGNVQNQVMMNTLGLYGNLGNTQTMSPQIASQMNQIGQTEAYGIQGQAEADQMAQQQNFNNIMGIGSMAARAFSDDRLKDNVVVIAYTEHPDIKKYRWEWNAKAEKLGLHGDDQGYIASEIERVFPECVHLHSSGYRQIDIPEIEKKLGEMK
jgi:hypothetical protein